MTTDGSGDLRPDDFVDRVIVAVGGGVLIFILALVAFGTSWIPGLLILALVPVHLVLAITDTSVFEDPKTVPHRALTELRRLTGGDLRGVVSMLRAPEPGAPPVAPPVPGAGHDDDPDATIQRPPR